jgi:L-ascorbate metabolism protein UlaG (beta-lactamase superfamily)
VVAAGAGWVVHRLRDHPSLEAWARHRLPAAGAPAPGREVTVTFLGVSTLLFDDGETRIMTDGFFTRPSLLRTITGRVAPDAERIGRGLERASVDALAAVLVVHSHYDHAMDAPEVARLTGAVLVGSESTANIGRGAGLPEYRMRVYRSGEPMQFGAFEVTPIRSQHFPHGMAMGEITAPLVPPARATAYLEGGSYSLLIRHPLGTALVQASAGWLDGALAGRRAQVVFLGVAGLGRKDEPYREGYFREIVETVDPHMVVPVHHDDFTVPLAEPPAPMPTLLDDVPGAFAFLERRMGTKRRLGILPAWQRVRLFPLAP